MWGENKWIRLFAIREKLNQFSGFEDSGVRVIVDSAADTADGIVTRVVAVEDGTFKKVDPSHKAFGDSFEVADLVLESRVFVGH